MAKVHMTDDLHAYIEAMPFLNWPDADLRNEFAGYLRTELDPMLRVQDVRSWWTAQTSLTPSLANNAQAALIIPPVSVAVERVFSILNHTQLSRQERTLSRNKKMQMIVYCNASLDSDEQEFNEDA